MKSLKIAIVWFFSASFLCLNSGAEQNEASLLNTFATISPAAMVRADSISKPAPESQAVGKIVEKRKAALEVYKNSYNIDQAERYLSKMATWNEVEVCTQEQDKAKIQECVKDARKEREQSQKFCNEKEILAAILDAVYNDTTSFEFLLEEGADATEKLSEDRIDLIHYNNKKCHFSISKVLAKDLDDRYKSKLESALNMLEYEINNIFVDDHQKGYLNVTYSERADTK